MKLSPPVSPKAVLVQVANALPQDCRQDVIIIGSLAAGYPIGRNERHILSSIDDAKYH